MLPLDLLDLTDIPKCRETIDGFLAQMPVPELPGNVSIGEVVVPGHGSDPDVRVKTYTPDDLGPGAPGFLWIHGGGMVLMNADGDDDRCARLAADHQMFVASVEYRLAPEQPAPGLVNDCFAALTWMAGNADSLGIDTSRIAIGGASAGGGLAAGTALYSRDNGGPGLVGQLLVFPMLDHRNETPSSHTITDPRVWNRESNRLAWEAYLGGGDPTPYTSPSIASDLSGLPPAYISVGQFDLFLDEDVAYAQELMRAGVAAELHVYPGAFHGSNVFVPDHPTSIRWAEGEAAFLSSVLGT
jgi:acetyl esterase/lipase